MSHIFISYSRHDEEYAHKLAERTERKGFNVWYDRHIDFGEDWQDAINTHITTCAAFIVIQNSYSRASQWVKNELLTAIDLKKPLFLILLEGEIWFEVRRIQVLDLRPTEENREIKFPRKEFYTGLRKSAPEAWNELLTDEEREETSRRPSWI